MLIFLLSAAFKDKELSINIESILIKGGDTVEACLHNHQGFKLASFTAGQARQLQQIVCSDPKLGNASHGLVCGPKSSKRVYGGLRDSAQWVIPALAPQYDDMSRKRTDKTQARCTVLRPKGGTSQRRDRRNNHHGVSIR